MISNEEVRRIQLWSQAVGVSASQAGRAFAQLANAAQRVRFPLLASVAPMRLAKLRDDYGPLRFFVREFWTWQYVMVRAWLQRLEIERQ